MYGYYGHYDMPRYPGFGGLRGRPQRSPSPDNHECPIQPDVISEPGSDGGPSRHHYPPRAPTPPHRGGYDSDSDDESERGGHGGYGGYGRPRESYGISGGYGGYGGYYRGLSGYGGLDDYYGGMHDYYGGIDDYYGGFGDYYGDIEGNEGYGGYGSYY